MPAITTLAKPATLGTGVLQIVSGSTVVATMHLKLQACDINYTQVVEETTGASDDVADTSAQHEGAAILGGSIALQGLVRSDKTIGIEGSLTPTQWIGIGNMFSTNNEYAKMRWSVGLASGIFLQGTMVVEQCRIRWVRTAATVQVTINGKITNTGKTATEATSGLAGLG
jgi:hypothetical protein